MPWYDTFATIYDRSLENLYAPYRHRVAEAVPESAAAILDLPTGTGQALPSLRQRLGTGVVVGVDRSAGMLARARRRVDDAGWTDVRLLDADATTLDAATLQAADLPTAFDAVVCSLGLTAFDRWEDVIATTWCLLRPGGRFVVFDVHAERRVLQTPIVEWMAQADLRRQVWTPLAALDPDFELTWLEGSAHTFGGKLFLATATRR